MANSQSIVPFIYSHEGGLSRDPSDTASAHPAPWPYKGVYGYHTNKGVTYATFSYLAKKLGYADTAENFFTMPADIWGKIYKYLAWDHVAGDQLKSLGIANMLADWYWGSGDNAIKNLQQVLNRSFKYKLAVDGGMGKQTIAATNAVDQKKLFDLLHAEKIDYYEQIVKNNPKQEKFLKGWKKRAVDLYNQNKTLVTVAAGGGLFFLLVGAAVIWYNWDDINEWIEQNFGKKTKSLA